MVKSQPGNRRLPRDGELPVHEAAQGKSIIAVSRKMSEVVWVMLTNTVPFDTMKMSDKRRFDQMKKQVSREESRSA